MRRASARLLIALPLIGVVACLYLFQRIYYFSAFPRTTNVSGMYWYNVNQEKSLVIGHQVCLVINKRTEVVLQAPCGGYKWWVFIVWPRDQLRGVRLGSGLKDNENNSYAFHADSVDIVWEGQAIRVPLR